jgi:hypothetical protein
MANWQARANRGLILFEGAGSDDGDRTSQIFNHILDENNCDDYISRGFFNVQQTAGGLPDGMSFDDFVAMVSSHVRTEGGSFDEGLSDDDFGAAALTFDDNIRRHIRFTGCHGFMPCAAIQAFITIPIAKKTFKYLQDLGRMGRQSGIHCLGSVNLCDSQLSIDHLPLPTRIISYIKINVAMYTTPYAQSP